MYSKKGFEATCENGELDPDFSTCTGPSCFGNLGLRDERVAVESFGSRGAFCWQNGCDIGPARGLGWLKPSEHG